MLSRMRIVILIAVLTGTSATLALFKYLQKQKENFPNTKSSFVSVVVARTQLPMGKKLSMEDLTASRWPRDIVPEGSYTEIPILLNRVLNTQVFQGEAILESKLAPKGSEGGFSSIIPPGMRALTVSVNSYSGVSGFILPNTHVDVLVTVPSPNQN